LLRKGTAVREHARSAPYPEQALSHPVSKDRVSKADEEHEDAQDCNKCPAVRSMTPID